jgi:hypothetical protein
VVAESKKVLEWEGSITLIFYETHATLTYTINWTSRIT